ncbi:hypothetical protein [uncultured Paludibaculum sp.]|uniref:YncE family protein n=1 Tax=uncultured Paludibaculum sp. TaxID=1765020 RepID=UPI002AAC2670|nr:hypothetical protein [uncultured Paludibaculum sp.]
MKRLILTLLALVGCLPGADQLLILHKLDDSFGWYDAESGKPEAKVTVGRKPHEFALSVDEKFAYVTNYGADSYTETQPGGNTITVIDLAARKVVGEIDLGEYHRPHGIERGKSGRFYVTTDFPAALLELDPRKRKIVRAIALSGKLPHMVQLTRDERKAWTANAGSGTVSIVDLANHKEITQVEVGGVPMGFALTPDEKNLFVATRTNNLVVQVDAVANKLKRKLGVPGEPARLASSLDGRWIYVSLIGSGEVAVLNAHTQLEVRRAAAGPRAEGVRLTDDGQRLYVSAQAENKVVEFTAPGLERVREIATQAKPDPIYLLRERKR